MSRYFLHLAYKGTNYCGWQVQPGQRTVQETLEKALSQLNSNQKVEVTGCGRTDTGVHASSYYAHFDFPGDPDTTQLKYKLNLMLPADIAIYEVFKTDPGAHARFDATSRTYQYHIHSSKNPFLADTSWYFTQKLDLDRINQACRIIAGQKDFEAFSKVNTSVNHFLCDIHAIQWEQTPSGHLFTVTANRFLRNMVRAIVGTLVDVGLGKTTPEEVRQILASKNRSQAGKSVPAEGLVLTAVTYPYFS